MSGNFLKFKKRALVICLLKSILAGLSVGLAVSAVLIFLYNHEVVALLPLSSALIGASVAIAVGVPLFFIIKGTDKTLARQIDESFALNEKVQTMLAYKDEHGAILELQREDADSALAAIKTGALKPRRLWIYIICLLLGAALLVCSLVILPEPEPYVPPVEEPFALTDIQIAALEELIAYVETSEMQSPYRESVALAVADLLAELRLATTERERDGALTRAIDAIYDQTDASSAAVELMNALWSGSSLDSVHRLAKAINYYDWPRADESDAFAEALAHFRTGLIHADSIAESADESKMTVETEELLRTTASSITLAFTVSGISSDDALRTVLARLATADESDENGVHLYGLDKIAALSAELGYKNMQAELDSSLALISADIFSALEQHVANTGTGEYAMTRISVLFDFELPKFERPEFYETTPDDSTPGEDGDNTGGGAGIGGETVYGSDDMVLDPITNTYVEYGTIIDKYYALMFSKTEEGDYTDAEKEAMEKYFAILYGGFDEE